MYEAALAALRPHSCHKCKERLRSQTLAQESSGCSHANHLEHRPVRCRPMHPKSYGRNRNHSIMWPPLCPPTLMQVQVVAKICLKGRRRCCRKAPRAGHHQGAPPHSSIHKHAPVLQAEVSPNRGSSRMRPSGDDHVSGCCSPVSHLLEHHRSTLCTRASPTTLCLLPFLLATARHL